MACSDARLHLCANQCQPMPTAPPSSTASLGHSHGCAGVTADCAPRTEAQEGHAVPLLGPRERREETLVTNDKDSCTHPSTFTSVPLHKRRTRD
ncbi:hypothetical protein QQF64_018178 [Cirrhinus molitorella]|uniref:Uncharacterized protein n=1 Tax=Cirrhinus molitorella TaxID=172907 RepID=A0ABR3LM52_9TELE